MCSYYYIVYTFYFHKYTAIHENAVVIAEHELIIMKDESSLLDWKKMGLRLTVPKGAIDDDRTVVIHIKALLAGKYHLPKGSELMSVVYLLSASAVLKKQITMEIEHCAILRTKDDCKSMNFVVASSTSQGFQFKIFKGGDFPIGKTYGSIDLSHFCAFAITGGKDANKGNQL